MTTIRYPDCTAPRAASATRQAKSTSSGSTPTGSVTPVVRRVFGGPGGCDVNPIPSADAIAGAAASTTASAATPMAARAAPVLMPVARNVRRSILSIIPPVEVTAMVQEPLAPDATVRVPDGRHRAWSTSVAGSACRQLYRTRSWVAELSSGSGQRVR